MGTIGTAGSVPLAAYVVAPAAGPAPGKWVDFGAVEGLVPGKVRMLPYKVTARDGWMVVPRTGVVWAQMQADGALRVFSSVCTHLGCTVSWREQSRTFECPCHSASFDANGAPVTGPPRRPLAVLESRVEDGKLQVLLPV